MKADKDEVNRVIEEMLVEIGTEPLNDLIVVGLKHNKLDDNMQLVISSHCDRHLVFELVMGVMETDARVALKVMQAVGSEEFKQKLMANLTADFLQHLVQQRGGE